MHANTTVVALLSLQVTLLGLLGPVALAGAMFAALITYIFVDAIPSTFLGIPDANTSLAVLPARVFCLEGNGEEAVLRLVGWDPHFRFGWVYDLYK
ncbi:MAG: tripartite tricarboxylate transporter permease [Methanomicrobiales archaeon]